jgi:hypothetical protein
VLCRCRVLLVTTLPSPATKMKSYAGDDAAEAKMSQSPLLED